MEKENHDANEQNDPKTSEDHHKDEGKNLNPIKKIKINFLKKFKGLKVINYLVLMLGILIFFNIALTSNIKNISNIKIDEAKESTRPAEIQLTIIDNPQCSDCFDLNEIISDIKNNNVDITDEETLDFKSKEAKDLIEKFDIKKIPTVLVFGEIEKSGTLGLNEAENALILLSVNPPYTETFTNEIIGRVSVTHISDENCKLCTDLSPFILQLKQAGVTIIKEEEIGVEDASSLISKYELEKIPAIIISKDLSVYDQITQNWLLLGSIEDDGSYIFREINPPYYDLEKKEVMGLVDITFLLDQSCSDCYDVGIHKQILTNPGGYNINIQNEKEIDISDEEGKELIKKYNIIKVPTILLSSEASVYPSAKSLENFFNLEDDGSYVFTNFDAMGKDIIYKDLTQQGN